MRYFLSLLLLFGTCGLWAQTYNLSGQVVDEFGDGLPFVSIYVEGTTRGTTSNEDGQFVLPLERGTYAVVFQYLGYTKRTEEIEVKKHQTIQIAMVPAAVNIKDIVVYSDKEDPAYRIIRQAIAHRSTYLEEVEGYKTRVYVKGTQWAKDMPERFMGQEIDAEELGLDSTRSGILYLSESLTNFLYQKPNRYKEEMISSRVSGNANGFSFNSARAMQAITFYDNRIPLNTSTLISPIAENALGYYTYELMGSFKDKGALVHKIQVTPKNPYGPVFGGDIYIMEDNWRIYSVDLYTTGKAARISVLDTLRLKQEFVPVQDSLWLPFKKQLNFTAKIIGITFDGTFVSIFSDYEINPTFEKDVFGPVVFEVKDSANTRDVEYWDSIRPVPLNVHEIEDYQVKDSLEILQESAPYLDSLDRATRGFYADFTGMGYNWSKRIKHIHFHTGISATDLMYNTVQGYRLGLTASYSQALGPKNAPRSRSIRIGGNLTYGFSDVTWRSEGSVSYRHNQSAYELRGGRGLYQYAHKEPIGVLNNQLYSLFFRRNYMKLYQRDYIELRGNQHLMRGLRLWWSSAYNFRRPARNHNNINWALQKNPPEFFSNYPLDTDFEAVPPATLGILEAHQAWVTSLSLRIRLKQSVIKYPNQTYYGSSPWPDFWLHASAGLPVGEAVSDFQYLGATIEDNNTLGVLGTLDWWVHAGYFFRTKNLPFVDWYHFRGNQTLFYKPDSHERLLSFGLLPYYEFSTQSSFGEWHVEHRFEGFLWQKIPLLKKLGYEFQVGAQGLWTEEKGVYQEYYAGLSRLGFKQFRILRVDAVYAMHPTRGNRWGVVLGINFSL